MSWLTLLSVLANLVKRLLGRLDEYETKQKQSEREQRRDDIRTKPAESFSDMFGKPSNEQLRSSTIERQADEVVRTNLSALTVDNESVGHPINSFKIIGIPGANQPFFCAYNKSLKYRLILHFLLF